MLEQCIGASSHLPNEVAQIPPSGIPQHRRHNTSQVDNSYITRYLRPTSRLAPIHTPNSQHTRHAVNMTRGERSQLAYTSRSGQRSFTYQHKQVNVLIFESYTAIRARGSSIADASSSLRAANATDAAVSGVEVETSGACRTAAAPIVWDLRGVEDVGAGGAGGGCWGVG